MLNRDECFDSIMTYGRKANLPWADGATASSLPQATKSAVPLTVDTNKSSATSHHDPVGSPVKLPSTSASDTKCTT